MRTRPEYFPGARPLWSTKIGSRAGSVPFRLPTFSQGGAGEPDVPESIVIVYCSACPVGESKGTYGVGGGSPLWNPPKTRPSEEVITLWVDCVMVKEKTLAVEPCAESTTLTTNEKTPAMAGVPFRRPFELIVRPSGS